MTPKRPSNYYPFSVPDTASRTLRPGHCVPDTASRALRPAVRLTVESTRRGNWSFVDGTKSLLVNSTTSSTEDFRCIFCLGGFFDRVLTQNVTEIKWVLVSGQIHGPVREGVSTDSLKFHAGPPCLTLICPVGRPPPKRPYGHLGGGPPAGLVACSRLIPPWIPLPVRAYVDHNQGDQRKPYFSN
jgi:hypothetical protein